MGQGFTRPNVMFFHRFGLSSVQSQENAITPAWGVTCQSKTGTMHVAFVEVRIVCTYDLSGYFVSDRATLRSLFCHG